MSDEKTPCLLMEKDSCDELIRTSRTRLYLVKSRINEYSGFEVKANEEILRILCELYISLDSLIALLEIAQAIPPQMHHGSEHYVLTETEGFMVQSLYLPAILELKERAEELGSSLTIN